MNTALLPQPLANARTTAAKAITVHISIDRHGATLQPLFKVRQESERDLRDDAVEHGALSSYQSS
jgi:hypothetical protein